MSKVFMLLFGAMLVLGLVAPVGAAPSSIETAVLCQDENCGSFAPVPPVIEITTRWKQVTTRGDAAEGLPLVYPLGGYKVILIHGTTGAEHEYDVPLDTLADPTQPSLVVADVYPLGFRVGDQLCAEYQAYNTANTADGPRYQISPRSARVCITIQ